ncbi:MAG: C-terminal binding protein [Candidatus Methylomirabilales bacterium]
MGARYGDLKIERDMLARLGVRLVEGVGNEEEETLSVCRDAEVILCGGAPKIHASLIRRLPKLKAIVRFGIGVDRIDLGEAMRCGIYVVNVPDYCIEEVATHAMTLVLAWARKLPVAFRGTEKGAWDIGPLRPLESPQDSILGLIGFGRIAQSVARMARAIGFQVWAADPYVKKKFIQRKRVIPTPLKRLIQSADFISLHLPLNSTTHHLIGAQALRLMKPTAYLINCARGGLVDEKALLRALKDGWIGGAALDVMEDEPWVVNNPLRGLDNLIVTPHCAWYTERSQKELRRKACSEVIRVLRGVIPKNVVNREVLKNR